jgi:hypothetical protein
MAIRATRLETRVRIVLVLAAGAVPISFAAGPLQAQVVVVRPIASVSFPTKFSFKERTIHVSQKVGFRFGARMTLTFSDRFDVTNTFTYSPGYATLHGGGKRFALRSASHSLTGSTSARYWIRPPGRPLSWDVHTGAGMVFGGNPSYLDLFESSTLSGFLGTAVRYQLGEIVSFTVKLQQRLFRVRFGDQDGGGSRPLQLRFGVGLPILEKLR